VSFLTVHSTLHLLGYDHELSEEDEKEMFSLQDEIMKIIGIER
jgi:probable rRNA maturation factor